MFYTINEKEKSIYRVNKEKDREDEDDGIIKC
jgi:hypothetical protein